MKKKVMLSITGRQAYQDQEPDTIELVTEGTMELRDGGWNIRYEETELTGMAGVTTVFRIEPGKIILTRTGRLHSQMIFQEGKPYDCLYQTEFGALMMQIQARQMLFHMTPEGGFVDLVYSIDIENTQAGEIDYHLDVRTIE